MHKNMPALVALLAALVAAPASAALYRCGNAFQDRPCDDNAQQQVIKPGRGAGAPAVPAPAAAPAPAPAPVPAAIPAAPVTPAAAVAAKPVKAGANPICNNLVEQRAALDARARSSTNPATLQMLQRQQRDVDNNLASAGCTP